MLTNCLNKFVAKKEVTRTEKLYLRIIAKFNMSMKNLFIKSFSILSLVAFAATGCKDKNAEKKIAELESRLDEGKSKSSAEATSDTTSGTGVEAEGPVSAFEFETTEHDFGTINEGDVVEYTYKFKNSGPVPLIIQGAQGSCGCTVPNWTKEPIPVGGSGVVTAKFDSHGKQNLQNKTVTVTANTSPKQTVLKFKAMVTPKISAEKGPLKK